MEAEVLILGRDYNYINDRVSIAIGPSQLFQVFQSPLSLESPIKLIGCYRIVIWRFILPRSVVIVK